MPTKHITPALDHALLAKLFRQLGSDNEHERAVVIAKINGELDRSNRTWADVPSLLGRGSTITVNADIAHHVRELGSHDAGERETSRQWLNDLLIRCRKTWNDLADLLLSPTSSSWADSTTDTTPPPGFHGSELAVIDLVHRVVEWYVWLTPAQRVAVTLWILHTHVYDRFQVTPRLALVSPVRACGNTVLVDLIEALVPKPEKPDIITPAALYHIIDERHPTVLLDKGDIGLMLAPNGFYRAILNSGHRRGGSRTILHEGRPRRFSTHAPLLVAGIGRFPLPLMHLAVVIETVRYDGSGELKRFTGRDPVIDYIFGRLRSWAPEVDLDAESQLPPQLSNRQADNWRPLIAIADTFGPEWGRRARDAAIELTLAHQDEDAGRLLLHDIRCIFDERRVDRLSSEELVAALNDLDDSMWCEWRGPQGDQQPRRLSKGGLAQMLMSFDIRPRTIWPPHRSPVSKSKKGYLRLQFESAWRSYCDASSTGPNL
jgi:putative DNA primase/helicase